MRRAVLSLSLVIGMLLVVPPAASGGGWWTSVSFSSKYLVAGSTVQGWTERVIISVSSPMLETGDTYYVYLIPNFDWSIVNRATRSYPPGDWWDRPEGAIRVGRVVLPESFRVKVEFVVPDVAPGNYALMVCDLSCDHPMGANIPTKVTIVDSPQALTLSKRLDRVKQRFDTKVARVRRQLSASIYDARSASATEYEVEFLRDRVSVLERAIEQIPASRPDPPSTWPLALGWGLAGAASGAALVLVRRRRIEVLVPVREEASERVPSATSMH